MEKIFIPGNVPSSKNSRRNYKNISLPSEATEKWRRKTKGHWLMNKRKFKQMIKGLEPPYDICFQFVRSTKHQFDYINPAQTVQDEMVKYHYLEDDNADFIKPFFDDYTYDKKNPGVYIYIKSR